MKTTPSAPMGRNQAQQGRQQAVTPTPPPWRITVCEVTGAIWIERRTGGTKEAVCKMGPNFLKDTDLANAELILAALNSHDRLVEACEAALGDFQSGNANMSTYDLLFAALAAAQPKP